MKSTYILPFFAFAVAPALSQPRNAASDRKLASSLTSRDDTIPHACTKGNTIMTSQLAEISQLQSNNLPIPPDLAGYFYSVVYGLKLLGCPSTPLLGADSNPDDVVDDHPEVRGDPCKVLQIIYEQAIHPISVLKDNNIPIPAYLAGSWSSVVDGNKDLKCGFSVSATANNNSTKSLDGTD